MQVLFPNNLPGYTMVLQFVWVKSETKTRRQLINEGLALADPRRMGLCDPTAPVRHTTPPPPWRLTPLLQELPDPPMGKQCLI